jgi:hypothetical protein
MRAEGFRPLLRRTELALEGDDGLAQRVGHVIREHLFL